MHVLVRAVEITHASPREERIPLHLATGGPLITINGQYATHSPLLYVRVRLSEAGDQQIDVTLAV